MHSAGKQALCGDGVNPRLGTIALELPWTHTRVERLLLTNCTAQAAMQINAAHKKTLFRTCTHDAHALGVCMSMPQHTV